ncbi:secretogranin-1 isoform X1 [Seriola lalandi dorsalis]|uniref:secretogranin-1 isoform X1 n=1 Tax=Seriola lalandi dorsalis TaxID=1841481 RepID=UPI000C6F895F|nr:secretogranin-1 isoform X1 [Seriola lalandi dorsalis]
MTLTEPKAFLPRSSSPLLSLFEALLRSSPQSSRRPVSAALSCHREGDGTGVGAFPHFVGIYPHRAKMRLIFVLAAAAALLTENLALPVGKEGQREDVITRCLVEVLSKALSKPDSQLDQECKDILQAGVKHAPLDKKSGEGIATHEEMVKGHPGTTEAKATDVKDIEALLKSVEEKRENPEDERSQESWSLDDEREKRHENEEEEERDKRNSWRPGRYHQKKHKRGEEEDNERSQESWGLEEKRSEEEEEGEDREKRNWRPGRYHQRKHKRDEEGEERDEPEEERSQEAWDVDKRHGNEGEERYKRIWKPTHRYHHKKKLHKRGDEPSEEEAEDRSQESWGLDDERDKRDWRPGRYHQRRHKRDEELSEEGREEPDEERSQESWDFDSGREKRDWRPGRYHQRRHKRDEELSEEGREEPDEERSQESWDFDTGREKRDWRPGRYHQRRHKRDEELSEEKQEEADGDRSQEYWGFDKRHGKEEGEIEKRIWKPTHRYHHKKKLHKRGGGSSEEEEEQKGDSEEYEEAAKDRDEALRYLAEKRNPWIFRGYYHPAWFKRDSDEHATTSDKMDEVAKLLSYKINQLANHSNQDEAKRSTHQRALTPQEEKELENLAAMDMELQKIAAKLHDKSA